ncbi:MAG: hypothetical protein V3S24_08920 [Candidatus Tectomicrobia bacterium]
MAKLTQKGKLLLGWGKVALTFAWLRQPADECTAGLAGQTGVMHAGPRTSAVVRNNARLEAWHFYRVSLVNSGALVLMLRLWYHCG